MYSGECVLFIILMDRFQEKWLFNKEKREEKKETRTERIYVFFIHIVMCMGKISEELMFWLLIFFTTVSMVQ